MKVSVGKVVRTKGIKGELIIYFFTQKLCCNESDIVFFENFNTDTFGPYKIEKISYYKTVNETKLYVIKLDMIDCIEDAKKLKNWYIVKEYERLPENVYIKSDIIGIDVILKENNKIIGKSVSLVDVKPGYKILIVRKDKEDIFIPFIKEVIHKIDIFNKQIIVNKIDGVTDNL